MRVSPHRRVCRMCPPTVVGTGCPWLCHNTSRQRLAWPQLRALPSEYFMGSHGRKPSCGFTGKNKWRESCWPAAAHWPARSCGGLAACPGARKTGVWPGEPGGMEVRLQLVEGLTGLTVWGNPWLPPHSLYRVPPPPPARTFHQGSGWG